MLKELNNNGLPAGTGAAAEAQRESRARQAHSEAERRALQLRNQLLRQHQRDMAVGDAVVEPVIGAEVMVTPVVATVLEPELISAPDDGAPVDLLADQHNALAHLSCVLGVFGELLIGGQDEASDTGENGGDETIIGSSDRAFDRALKTAFIPFPLRPSPIRRPAASLPALRPTSRLACQRRCGTAGFCDPASEHGCGGQYCPLQPDLLQASPIRVQRDGSDGPNNADAAAGHDID